MRTCRYCRETVEDITYHLNFDRICKREHSLWKRELQLTRRETEINRREHLLSYFLNEELLFDESNIVVDEICIVMANGETESPPISVLNKYSTDTIFQSLKNCSCPVCLEDIKERTNFAVLTSCGHHLCMSCVGIMNQQVSEKLCPVCRTPI